MSLRDKLLAALADVPGTRTFHLHVFTSAPRKHNGLFPYAHPRPRTYLQDVFILLSEQESPDSDRVLVTAIEASVYNIPTTHSGVLYVSKVDSSGHASAPSPTTTLVRAFLTYYADPVTRPIAVQHLWIQLFARAQGQYLFPNSSEYEGKRPLSDVRLCAWWRRVFGEVAGEVHTRLKGSGKVKLFYVLPGYSELEASNSLTHALAVSGPPGLPWAYGHPYSQTDIPLPCPRSPEADAPHNLGTFIPWFDDDPKSRFIDEIACTTNTGSVRSPKRKRARTNTGPRGERRSAAHERDGEHDEKGKDQDKDRDTDERPHIEGELSCVSADEFWERMSFRQECVAGAITGFFTLCVSTPPPVQLATSSSSSSSQPSPLAPQPGQVASTMVQRIVSTLMTQNEFSTRERAVRATATLERTIKGLCEDAPVLPAPAPPAAAPSAAAGAGAPPEPERPRTPEPDCRATLEVPCTPPPGRSHLRAPAAGRGGGGGGGGGRGGLPEISPNPFPDPVATPETYASYIYGSIAVRNRRVLDARGGDAAGDNGQGTAANGGTEASSSSRGPAPGTGAAVTVLTARKKRKQAPS